MAFTKYCDADIARFEAKVDKKEDDECWLWKGGKTKNGYGQFWRNGTHIGAHRMSLELHLQREIRAGLFVCHAAGICHKRDCVNPHHLREDTVSNNTLDKHIDGTFTISKLTAVQVLEIRASSGKLQRELAIEYGVSRSYISEIISRKMWKHLPPK